ncbi:hypothetical protein BV97_03257 [Novosphingobium resinovorum]|uniref:Uncharacterized protein n=1 Tax=Novosphingobium resinovorum TaxID=158500 RepID=A0A031JVC9_9SPHN|nr:hypothetical protein [Novosphingobium resinovorum]EZP80834.1 hypothetical protein BV97_03257 [Novosphingobium resinovorum]
MNKTSMTILAALALGAFAPSVAGAQTAQHDTHTAARPVVKKTTTVRKTGVTKKQPAKKLTCRYQVQRGKKVRVCK